MSTRITLHDGETVETHLFTKAQIDAALVEGRDITVGGDDDTWYGPEDQLPEVFGDRDGVLVQSFDQDRDLRGTKPLRTIPAELVASVEEAGA